MSINYLAIVFLVLQVGAGHNSNFEGFVPDKSTALEVARPILKKSLGEKWLKYASPLRADLVMDRWVIKGTFQGVRQRPEVTVEPYLIAIDKWSSRVALFGPIHLIDIRKELSKLPSDRPIK